MRTKFLGWGSHWKAARRRPRYHEVDAVAAVRCVDRTHADPAFGRAFGSAWPGARLSHSGLRRTETDWDAGGWLGAALQAYGSEGMFNLGDDPLLALLAPRWGQVARDLGVNPALLFREANRIGELIGSQLRRVCDEVAEELGSDARLVAVERAIVKSNRSFRASPK